MKLTSRTRALKKCVRVYTMCGLSYATNKLKRLSLQKFATIKLFILSMSRNQQTVWHFPKLWLKLLNFTAASCFIKLDSSQSPLDVVNLNQFRKPVQWQSWYICLPPKQVQFVLVLKLFPVYAAYCLYSCVMRTVVLPCLCCLYLICCNSVYAPFSPAFTLPY